MDRLRLCAGVLMEDWLGTGREGWSGASDRTRLVLDSRRGGGVQSLPTAPAIPPCGRTALYPPRRRTERANRLVIVAHQA